MKIIFKIELLINAVYCFYLHDRTAHENFAHFANARNTNVQNSTPAKRVGPLPSIGSEGWRNQTVLDQFFNYVEKVREKSELVKQAASDNRAQVKNASAPKLAVFKEYSDKLKAMRKKIGMENKSKFAQRAHLYTTEKLQRGNSNKKQEDASDASDALLTLPAYQSAKPNRTPALRKEWPYRRYRRDIANDNSITVPQSSGDASEDYLSRANPDQRANLEAEQILEIKEEVKKLQNLVQILRDQEYILNMLSDVDINSDILDDSPIVPPNRKKTTAAEKGDKVNGVGENASQTETSGSNSNRNDESNDVNGPGLPQNRQLHQSSALPKINPSPIQKTQPPQQNKTEASTIENRFPTERNVTTEEQNRQRHIQETTPISTTTPSTRKTNGRAKADAANKKSVEKTTDQESFWSMRREIDQLKALVKNLMQSNLKTDRQKELEREEALAKELREQKNEILYLKQMILELSESIPSAAKSLSLKSASKSAQESEHTDSRYRMGTMLEELNSLETRLSTILKKNSNLEQNLPPEPVLSAARPKPIANEMVSQPRPPNLRQNNKIAPRGKHFDPNQNRQVYQNRPSNILQRNPTRSKPQPPNLTSRVSETPHSASKARANDDTNGFESLLDALGGETTADPRRELAKIQRELDTIRKLHDASTTDDTPIGKLLSELGIKTQREGSLELADDSDIGEKLLEQLTGKTQASDSKTELKNRLKKLELQVKSLAGDTGEGERRSQLLKLLLALRGRPLGKNLDDDDDDDDVSSKLKTLKDAIDRLRPKEDLSQEEKQGDSFQSMLQKLVAQSSSKPKPVTGVSKIKQKLNKGQIALLNKKLAAMLTNVPTAVEDFDQNNIPEEAEDNQNVPSYGAPNCKHGHGYSTNPDAPGNYLNSHKNYAYSGGGPSKHRPTFSQNPPGNYDYNGHNGYSSYGSPIQYGNTLEESPNKYGYAKPFEPGYYGNGGQQKPTAYGNKFNNYSPGSNTYGQNPTNYLQGLNLQPGSSGYGPNSKPYGPNLNPHAYGPATMLDSYPLSNFGSNSNQYPDNYMYPSANNLAYLNKLNYNQNTGLNSPYYGNSQQVPPGYDGNHFSHNTAVDQLFQLYQNNRPKTGYSPNQAQPYKTEDGTYQANVQQSAYNSPQNYQVGDGYTNHRIYDLKKQIYTLQNVINTLNRPEYVQRPEDKLAVYNLDKQINDLKYIINNLDQKPSTYNAGQFSYQPKPPSQPAYYQAPPPKANYRQITAPNYPIQNYANPYEPSPNYSPSQDYQSLASNSDGSDLSNYQTNGEHAGQLVSYQTNAENDHVYQHESSNTPSASDNVNAYADLSPNSKGSSGDGLPQAPSQNSYATDGQDVNNDVQNEEDKNKAYKKRNARYGSRAKQKRSTDDKEEPNVVRDLENFVSYMIGVIFPGKKNVGNFFAANQTTPEIDPVDTNTTTEHDELHTQQIKQATTDSTNQSLKNIIIPNDNEPTDSKGITEATIREKAISESSSTHQMQGLIEDAKKAKTQQLKVKKTFVAASKNVEDFEPFIDSSTNLEGLTQTASFTSEINEDPTEEKSTVVKFRSSKMPTKQSGYLSAEEIEERASDIAPGLSSRDFEGRVLLGKLRNSEESTERTKTLSKPSIFRRTTRSMLMDTGRVAVSTEGLTDHQTHFNHSKKIAGNGSSSQENVVSENGAVKQITDTDLNSVDSSIFNLNNQEALTVNDGYVTKAMEKRQHKSSDEAKYVEILTISNAENLTRKPQSLDEPAEKTDNIEELTHYDNYKLSSEDLKLILVELANANIFGQQNPKELHNSVFNLINLEDLAQVVNEFTTEETQGYDGASIAKRKGKTEEIAYEMSKGKPSLLPVSVETWRENAVPSKESNRKLTEKEEVQAKIFATDEENFEDIPFRGLKVKPHSTLSDLFLPASVEDTSGETDTTSKKSKRSKDSTEEFWKEEIRKEFSAKPQAKERSKRSTEDTEEDDDLSELLHSVLGNLFEDQDEGNQIEKDGPRETISQDGNENVRPNPNLADLNVQLDQLNKELGSMPRSSGDQQNYQPLNERSDYYNPYGQFEKMGKRPKIGKLKGKKTSKKLDFFGKIFDKILEKIVKVAIPKTIEKFFGIGKADFVQYASDDGYGYQGGYNGGYGQNGVNLQAFKSFGLSGYIPMIVLKLFSNLTYFISQLQKNRFLKNFLVPGLVLLGVSGMVVFLIWWLQPNDYDQNNSIGYQGGKSYGANQNYNSYGSYTQQYPPPSYDYNMGSYNNAGNYYRSNYQTKDTPINAYQYKTSAHGYPNLNSYDYSYGNNAYVNHYSPLNPYSYHNGYNHNGYNHNGYNHNGYNHNGYNHNGYNNYGYRGTGEYQKSNHKDRSLPSGEYTTINPYRYINQNSYYDRYSNIYRDSGYGNSKNGYQNLDYRHSNQYFYNDAGKHRPTKGHSNMLNTI